jgi:hypothetical protein
MGFKTFTVRDEKNNVVAGLENVSGTNALLTTKVVFDKSLSCLDVEETTQGVYREERYFVTRTA